MIQTTLNRTLEVNDIHSGLNPTVVSTVFHPVGIKAIADLVKKAREAKARISISGGRHAMGGQQFGRETWLVDLRSHTAIHSLDRERGWITVNAGVQWRTLIKGYLQMQGGEAASPIDMYVGFGLAFLLCTAATLVPVEVALKRLERVER